MNADGTEALLTSPSRRSESPDWAPRGDRIAYVEWRGSTTRIIETDIYTVATDGTDRRRLTSAAGEDTDPAWSPDGQLIAFASDRAGNFELYVMNADGSGQRRLTRTRAIAEYGPAWSPNGRRIAFWRRTHSDAIATMNANGTDRRRLTAPSADAAFPTWSPDGTRIAYVRGSDPFEEAIWVMSASGRNHRRLVRGEFTEPMDLDWGSGFAG
jgi:Tol biopolymer transport system component